MKLIDGSAFSDQLLIELKSKSTLMKIFHIEKNNCKIVTTLNSDRTNIIIESYYDREFIKEQYTLDSYEKSINLHEWYKFLGNAGIQIFSMTYKKINDQDTNNA